MEILGTCGVQLLASMIEEKTNILKYGSMSLTVNLFTGAEQEIFELFEQHVYEYGVVPTRETAIKFGMYFQKNYEPPKYYLDKVVTRHLHQEIKKVLINAQNHLKEKNVLAAYEDLEQLVHGRTIHNNQTSLVNFTTNSHNILKADYLAKKLLGDTYGVRMGWDYLDKMTSGLTAGDLVAVIGRIAQGKTFNLLYMAEHNWRVHKKIPLFVSMEMSPLPLIQRIAAMYLHKPITQIKKSELSTVSYKGMLSSLFNLPSVEQDFWIVDGKLTTKVKDIALLVHQLKPDVVYVDGAYLLKPDDRSNSNWEKIKNTCEGLKRDIATELGIPVVASYQFSREAITTKQAGLEHIGGTDAIGQIATIVLGMFQEDGVETIKEKEIRILKGRNGETGSFRIRWVFDEPSDQGMFMDFSEITEDEINTESDHDLEWI